MWPFTALPSQTPATHSNCMTCGLSQHCHLRHLQHTATVWHVAFHSTAISDTCNTQQLYDMWPFTALPSQTPATHSNCMTCGLSQHCHLRHLQHTATVWHVAFHSTAISDTCNTQQLYDMWPFTALPSQTPATHSNCMTCGLSQHCHLRHLQHTATVWHVAFHSTAISDTCNTQQLYDMWPFTALPSQTPATHSNCMTCGLSQHCHLRHLQHTATVWHVAFHSTAISDTCNTQQLYDMWPFTALPSQTPATHSNCMTCGLSQHCHLRHLQHTATVWHVAFHSTGIQQDNMLSILTLHKEKIKHYFQSLGLLKTLDILLPGRRLFAHKYPPLFINIKYCLSNKNNMMKLGNFKTVIGRLELGSTWLITQLYTSFSDHFPLRICKETIPVFPLSYAKRTCFCYNYLIIFWIARLVLQQA